MDVDLRKVRYFMELAEHLHFGRAAKSLHIAQPVLSRQIRALEGELGVELLVRTSRSVALTLAGEQLVTGGRELLDRASSLARQVATAGRGRPRLTIGFTCGVLITPVVRRFLEEVSDVDVSVVHVERDQQTRALYDGVVDVAFVRKPLVEDDLTLYELFRERRMAILPVGHHLAERAYLTRADLAGEALIHHAGTRDLAVAKGQARRRGRITAVSANISAFPEQVRDVRAMEEKLELVAAGAGLTLLPESAAGFYSRPDLVRLPVVDLPPESVCLARLVDSTSPLIGIFTRLAQELLTDSRVTSVHMLEQERTG